MYLENCTQSYRSQIDNDIRFLFRKSSLLFSRLVPDAVHPALVVAECHMARCHDACFYASINSHLTFAAWLNSNANFSPKKKQVERQMKSWRQARRHAKSLTPSYAREEGKGRGTGDSRRLL